MVTITQAFENKDAFENMLVSVGMGANERTHLIDVEGFNSMKTLVQHTPRTKDFQKVLEDVTKSLGGAALARQVLIGKVVMSHALAVHFYTIKCLAINKIPDIRIVDVDKAVQYMNSMDRSKDDTDTKKDWVKIDKFTGDNWSIFQTKFRALLKNRHG